MDNKKKVVIVGGGFAGIHLAKKFANNSKLDVIVLDQHNYHFFPPLLYEVSTAFIEPSNIIYPFRKLFQKASNIRFHMGKLDKVLPEFNKLVTDQGTLSYDYLVLAMGTEPNYFGNENIKKNALAMKSIEDALTIRNHILFSMEKSMRSEILEEKQKFSTIVIAGGGPTGVELAGKIAELGRNIADKDYPEALGVKAKIYLIEGAPNLLNTMSINAQQEAYRVLEKLGVIIMLNTLVNDYQNSEVALSSGEIITAETLLWTSGVKARKVDGIAAACIGRGDRILVNDINQVEGYSNLFCIGDQSLTLHDTLYPQGHPQLAQVAIQQGKQLAENLQREILGIKTKPFLYKNKGSMAMISKFKAVVDLPKIYFGGLAAWVVWLLVHLVPLTGVRNRLKLLSNWFWSLMTNDPALRSIIGKVKQ
ncbi:FAD-dependent oxidoreductase [Flavobacterium sp. IR1]|nr:FAD-dependent oxidoreductase [Flavobacterium sp. IR1]